MQISHLNSYSILIGRTLPNKRLTSARKKGDKETIYMFSLYEAEKKKSLNLTSFQISFKNGVIVQPVPTVR